MITVYTYKSCDTCRQATKWLAAEAIAFEEKPIRETPPTTAELGIMLTHLGGERRRLCNTYGKDYRDLKFGDSVEILDEADFLMRLATNGNLIKRPFLLRRAAAGVPAYGLIGFSVSAWAAALR